MIDGKKIIGLCLTKIYDGTYADYSERLRKYAKANNCKIIAFNSLYDFYELDSKEMLSSAVYDFINYDMLDGLIVIYDSFCISSVPDSVISRAKSANIPVLVINAEIEGCHSIVGDFENEYKALIRHVLRDHNVKNAVFMAGLRGEKNSEKRKKCFTDVMDELDLKWSDDNIVYGDYWETPAMLAMDRIVARGKGMPEAVICANDQMAMTVCEWLGKNNYRVPEDVIVTGFDGLDPVEYFIPSITTCCCDWDKIARLSIEIMCRFEKGKDAPCEHYHDIFSNSLNESCGCSQNTQSFREKAQKLYKDCNNYRSHEEFITRAYKTMFDIQDIDALKECISGFMLEASYICIDRDIVNSYLDSSSAEAFTEELDVINSVFSKGDDIYNESTVMLRDMIPNLKNGIKDNSMFIISPIFAENRICGLYIVKSEDITDVAHKIMRLDIVITNCFNALFNNAKQKRMMEELSNSALVNPVTGLLNLKGVTTWFNEFSSKEENHKKTVCFSVYNVRKYNYIYENHGLLEIEKCLKFIADSMRKAVVSNGKIAHISEDTFLLINVAKDESEASDTINETTDIFYGLMNERNAVSEYYLEVNAGCTVANAGWSGLLSGFVRLANSELYINRIRYSDEYVSKSVEKREKRDYTEKFNILLERNLFSYFFQPIIDARTGDIFAYEALMRTSPEIGMNPLEVLETAEAQNRLYEIERATVFNVLERLSKDIDKFKNRNVFINTIPGYFLNEDDNFYIGSRYSELLKYLVIEITEQNSITDDELNTIKHIGNSELSVPIAVDDYGTGHSNIVNLMRYSPQIVKIDRFLITDVDKDINKQMFVKSTIEFARMNNMKVLAEGVETSEELCTVVSYGVDYIQGYYTGRPAPDPIDELRYDVREEIRASQPEDISVYAG